MATDSSPNLLYFGDNLPLMRQYMGDESVDLCYLDPPFNSARAYNVLYKEPDGSQSDAQIQAFGDTWRWDDATFRQHEDNLKQAPAPVAGFMGFIVNTLGRNDTTAYLTMMAPRLVEIRRILKPHGSVYLHCDTTASHYLKLLLDQVFGPDRFLNEITWKRHNAHNNPKRYGRIQDRILFYAKSETHRFHPLGGTYSEAQRKRYKEDEQGRLYRADDLTAPSKNPGRSAPWRGVDPGARRSWRYSEEKLEELYAAGRILLQQDGRPRKDGLKVLIDEEAAPALQDLWTDIPRIGNTSAERLGYPTQKPVALLKRIIEASSRSGDVVFDPFCGCGTTIAAAEELGRRWIGMDITHLAIHLVEKRVKERFGTDLRPYKVLGVPTDLQGAAELARRDRHEFEWWALAQVEANPARDRKKGADQGVDGWIFFSDGGAKRILVQVKSGHVNRATVATLKGDMEREKAAMGLLITLENPTAPMRDEARAAGGYVSELYPDRLFDRIQILSVADLLAGAIVAYPHPLKIPGHKTATRAKGHHIQTPLL